MDEVVGGLVRRLEGWAQAVKAWRCRRYGHSYRWLTGATWNCHKCGRLKLLR